MSDLIYREQAKDAIDKYLVGRNLVTDGTFMARLINEIVIDRLPSAQLTFDARDTQYNLPIGTDCISRQAAIDTLENTKTAISENGERYIAKQNAIMRIDALPSAQPTFDARDTQYNLPIGKDVPDTNVGDTISRQAAIDDIWTVSPLVRLDRKWVDRWLRQLPSAQPKRGRWIEDKGQQTLMKNFIERGEVWRVCSVCGAGHMIGHKYAIDKAYHDRHHNYCPNCGAKMEGKDE